MSTDLNQAEQELACRIRKGLESRNILAIRDLTIETEGSTVTLKGSVRSYYLRQLVVHGCLHVPGVRAIIDKLTVGG